MRAFIDRLSRPQLVLAGALAGFTWGVLIRLWMRLISTDPAFTWGGTLYILGAATILGVGVAGGGRRAALAPAMGPPGHQGARRALADLPQRRGGRDPGRVGPAGDAGLRRASVVDDRARRAFGLSLLPLRVAVSEIERSGGPTKTLIATVLYVALASVLVLAWGSVVRSRPSRRAVRRQAEREADRVGRVGDGSLELVG